MKMTSTLKVAHFKVPRYWLFKNEFPMTVTGKVQKFRMRDMTVEELGLDSAPENATPPWINWLLTPFIISQLPIVHLFLDFEN